MRHPLPLLLLVLLTLLPAVAAPAARKRRAPQPAAALCEVSADDQGMATVTVIAARRGRVWLDSEDARELLHRGDRLSLLTPQGTLLGEVTLTGRGRLLSKAEGEGGIAYGLEFRGTVHLRPGMEATASKATHHFATWSRGLPAPAWVRWMELPKPAKGSPYWQAALAWLHRHKLPEGAVETLRFEQAARADVNGDGKQEVLLSFVGVADPAQEEEDAWQAKPYSFLLLRVASRGRRIVTHLLDDTSWALFRIRVVGLCDLDRDGQAEVITEEAGIDTSGTSLYHWNGRRFVTVGGYGWGA